MYKFTNVNKQTKNFHSYYVSVNKTKHFFKNVLTISSAFVVFFSNCPIYSIKAATTCAFAIEGGTAGTDYTYDGGILTIKSSKPMIIKNSVPNVATTDRIEINSEANLTLAGVNIEATEGAAMKIVDNATFNVAILLADDSENNLKGREASFDGWHLIFGSPGIEKNGEGDNIGLLTIDVPNGSKGTGKLTTIGGGYGAGIGGGHCGDGSNIMINGGTVTATGGDYAAGIGGGWHGSGSDITINDGTVTANGGRLGAGIGGGCARSGNNITISGGKVTANGGEHADSIGGGFNGSGSNITIKDGVLKM